MIVSALTMFLLVQAARPVQPPPEVYRSERAAVAFAIRDVCLPATARGAAVGDLFTPGFLMRGRGDGVRRHVQSFVWIDERNGACTVVSSRGSAPTLRAEVVATITPAATGLTVLSDTGEGSRDSNGDFRQEAWCMRVEGRPVFLVMSTSEASNRNRLMASFGLDREGRCPG